MINNRNAIPVLCLGLTFCLIWGLSGCGLATGGSYLKKQLICGFDGWMQNFSMSVPLSAKRKHKWICCC